MDYRKKIDFSIFKPDGISDDDRGSNECCCEIPVFASLTDSLEWKNDHSIVFYKKAVATDTVEFMITRCGDDEELDLLGLECIFPNDDLAEGFIFDWNQYLNTYGIGNYTVTINYTIAGIPSTVEWGEYNLQVWSQYRVGGYVRLRSIFNTYNQKKDIDFTGSNCFDTLRVAGIFGKRDPKMEINQLITKGFISEKVTRRNDNEYQLESDMLSYCITSRLVDIHLIDEDQCFITEHNKKSHFYGYIDYPVHVQESPKLNYYTKTRPISVIVTFADRVKNDKSMFNGL